MPVLAMCTAKIAGTDLGIGMLLVSTFAQVTTSRPLVLVPMHSTFVMEQGLMHVREGHLLARMLAALGALSKIFAVEL